MGDVSRLDRTQQLAAPPDRAPGYGRRVVATYECRANRADELFAGSRL